MHEKLARMRKHVCKLHGSGRSFLSHVTVGLGHPEILPSNTAFCPSANLEFLNTS